MKPQQAVKPGQSASMELTKNTPAFIEAEKLIERMAELTMTVAKRAYEFFESRGRQFGGELEDWLRAESELLRQIPVTITETDGMVVVKAEVPGFKASEIKISLDPYRLLVEGRFEHRKPEKDKEKTAKVIFNEFSANCFYRSIALPVEVDPATATATLENGVLKIALKIKPAQQSVNVEVKTTESDTVY